MLPKDEDEVDISPLEDADPVALAAAIEELLGSRTDLEARQVYALAWLGLEYAVQMWAASTRELPEA